MKKREVRIAWFSILPEGENAGRPDALSAYFSKHLLPLLQERFDITLYTNSFLKYRDFKTEHFLKAFQHEKEKPYDIFFYQLEDDPRANFVRSHIGLIPGITYFHHFNLTNYGPEPLLNSPYTDVLKLFKENEGAWPDRQKKYKPRGPAAYREAALSVEAIFSTAHSLNEYKRLVDLKINQDSKGYYLPYPVEILPANQTVKKSGFKVALIGSARIEHRAHKVLSALPAETLLKWVVHEDQKSEARELLREFGFQNAELVTEYNERGWREVVQDSDAAVHSLFSAYGHTEPFLAISLSYGKPVVVTDFASTEHLPPELVFKVQPGQHESFQMKQIFERIKGDSIAVQTGRVMDFVNEVYDPKRIAQDLSQIFINTLPLLKSYKERWQSFERKAHESLLSESGSLVDPGLKSYLDPVYKELGWTC